MTDARVRIVGQDATDAAWRSATSKAQAASRRMSALFKTAFAGISLVAVTGGLSRAIGESVRFGDELGKAAVKSGIAVKSFSELAHAAKMADVDMGSLSTSLARMQRSLSEASTGNKSVLLTLDAIGLKLKDLQALSPDKQFEAIAEGISRLKDPADRTRAAMELFGRSGADLLPLFEQGAKGIRAAREEAVALGRSLDEVDVKRLQAADDAFKRLRASVGAVANTLAIGLAPAIVKVADALLLLSGRASEMDKLDRELGIIENRIRRFERIGSPKALAHAAEARAQAAEIRRQMGELNLAAAMRDKALSGGSDTAPGFAAADTEAADKEATKRLEEYWTRRGELARQQFEQEKQFDKILLDLRKSVLPEEETLAEERARILREGIEAEEARFNKFLEKVKEIDEAAEKFKESWGSVFQIWAMQGQRTARSLGKAILAELFNKQVQKAIDLLFGSLGKTKSSGDARGGFLGFLGGLFGFQHGGSFTVGGSGGTDSQLVAFKASPGEKVSISPSGRGTGGLTVAPVYKIDARGATQDLVAQLPRILRENNAALEFQIIDGIKRRKYDLS